MAKGILTVIMLSGVPAQTETPASSSSSSSSSSIWCISTATTTSTSSAYHFTHRKATTSVFMNFPVSLS
jgi:hypothetical protein